MPASTRLEDVEAKYDVVLNYPNLELHSAAAAGNVGLVHYALTHGQPVNSVLHGVLPLHAACSGGSVSVVRMLIERGADVNAPRLPRRYSDGKRSNAPSVGAAGSTPLHFAAANGHAPIAQILLTCGAIPDKQDKNGMTPETLAEINRHTDVIRVLRVWEHLQAQESHARLSSLGGEDSVEPLESGSPSTSASLANLNRNDSSLEVRERLSSFGSRKGKERAFSFSSNASEAPSTAAIKVKQSFEALFRGRPSRSASAASQQQRPNLSASSSLQPLEGLRINTKGVENQPDPEANSLNSPKAFSPPTSPVATYGPDGSMLNREPSGLSGYSGQSTTTLGLGSIFPDPPERDPSSSNLASSPSKSLLGPSPSRSSLGPPPSRSTSTLFGSSRRPSLPSILEKAAHPGQAIRQAFKRDHHHHPQNGDSAHVGATSPTSPNSVFSSASRSPPSSGYFRGRHRSNDYNVSPETQRVRKYGHKYMSKHALLHLFRRGHSPPSRSPSPPQRSESRARPLLPEEVDEGIEKLRRASLDLSMREGKSVRGDDDQSVFSGLDVTLPNSAPAHKSSFFSSELELPTFSSLTIDPAMIPLPSSPSPSISTLASDISESRLSPINLPERRHTTSRKGSGMAAPSPLANEWAQSSDSDSPSVNLRRSKSEVVKSASQTTITSPSGTGTSSSRQPSTPSSPLHLSMTAEGPTHVQTATSKPRSATLPSRLANFGSPNQSVPRSQSGGRIMGWAEGVDLRKVASGILRRRSTRSRKRSDPKSPTKSDNAPARDNILKIHRVSEEKDVTLEGDQAETETIKLAERSGAVGEAEGKQSQDSGTRTEGGADADIEEDEDDEYHDAEDASLFDYAHYIRFAEPLDMDLTSSTSTSDRPSTPVVVVQSPVDESGSATVEVIHTPDEDLADEVRQGYLSASSVLPSQVAARLDGHDNSDTDIATTDTERGDRDARRATSEETERGDRTRPADIIEEEGPSADQNVQPPASSMTKLLEADEDAMEPEAHLENMPVQLKKPTPPRSRFVEIISQEDIAPVRRQSSYRSWTRFGRYRGASLSTAGGTESTRIVTPPSLRMSLASSEDLGSSPPLHKRVGSIKSSSPPAPSTSSLYNVESRARGKSVSSSSTSNSGMGYSYGQSTAGTSLTPPSTLSLGGQGGFPPVPEHDVVHPQPRRQASTSAEARELIKQTESDILQIAQLPDSLDSSRSLAAQLAAYGESHAMEEVFAEREKKKYIGSEDGGSDRDSFFSALSDGVSRVPSEFGSEGRQRPSSLHSFGRRSYGSSLFPADAPQSASINLIYDKRAAAYKERMAALTAGPAHTFPSSASTHSRRSQHHRRRVHANAARAGSPMSTDAWLDAGSQRPGGPADAPQDNGEAVDESYADQYPGISSPLPLNNPSSQSPLARSVRKLSFPLGSSSTHHQPSSKPSSVLAPSIIRSTRSLSPAASRLGSASFSGLTPLTTLNPSRYAGLASPMQSLGSVGAAAAARTPSITSGFSNGAGAGGTIVPSTTGSSPYISVFSNRFTGPHDGDDSDDEEQQPQQYMMIENDWMGGHVVDPEGEKKSRWDHLRNFGKPKK
ncbi:hypothetical protein BD324DRAFT_616516 [Kockovaella imperatae]|uniref:Uncharacterized protein n=1 Tax=Kockovaella imperatae TaxID=4999 RepID=A0A1Y1UQ40_9TREE|nr:hypothetical protein BD324DRAFT_616516 [Kockovaella imperatae]ORX40143.1 hypothetical protein BD324DRAFT_616516 [Kockovaella imperatae]